ADALRDRALDLVVRPAADAELRMLRDVRREGVPRLAERLREQIPAGADSREVVLTFDERRVAIRAVAERMREIAAVRDLVVLVRLRHRADGRSPVRRQLDAIRRSRYLVAYRRNTAQIRDDRPHVAIRDVAVERVGHRRTHHGAV